ncbi:YciI family protein [Labedaea rhizosphaerae]|uniref:YCII-related domain-containing protein n=1 Tax=Labedaea rhizosphaerae TaxID=598644 RepID=A0A4R6RWE7_LABRH|nr:YciI family protein [Labedaea rhizosphaerae]TDP91124.1 hypothetical protein EV186_109116 [Labedaea rhizosphaerae]
MRFMVIVKATPEQEASGGAMPSAEDLELMGKFNEELVRAGVMLAGEGLLPSAKGAKVSFDHGKTTVTDGPFTEAKELIAGFWLLQTRSMEETVEWAKRIPFQEGEVEIRQISELEDFEPVMTPEIAEREQRLRDQLSGN